jgi:hypothetical protein
VEDAGTDGSAVGFDCAGGGDGQKQDEERVEVESFAQMAVEQSGEGAGGAASGAVDAEEGVDGAGGVESGLRGRVEEKHGAKQERGCERRVGDDSAETERIAH